MPAQQKIDLRLIEGRQVNVALRDGTRIDDCNLVSSGRNCVDNLWLCTNGEDVIVALEDVIDVWETDNNRPHESVASWSRSAHDGEEIIGRSDTLLHYCRIVGEGQPRCTCGWGGRGQFTSGGARNAEIDHLISVGATWADPLAV